MTLRFGIWDWNFRNIMKFIKNYSPAWNPLTDFELVVSMSLVPGKKLFLSAYCVLYCFFAFSIEVRYSFCLCSHTKKIYVLNFHEILSEQLPVLSVSYTYALRKEFLNFVQKLKVFFSFLRSEVWFDKVFFFRSVLLKNHYLVN